MFVFKFEQKKMIKPILSYSLIAVGLLWFLMWFYDQFALLSDVLVKMLATMPPEFLKAFDFDISSFLSYESYVAFIFMEIGLFLSIMSASFTFTIFGREKNSRCEDFVFTKPIERREIFLEKLLALIISITVVTSLLILAFAIHANGKAGENIIPLMALSSFLTCFFFSSVSLVIATHQKKPADVSTLSASVGIIGFLLYVLYNLLEKSFLQFFPPFEYFNPGKLAMGLTQAGVIPLGIAISAILSVVSFLKYVKKDVETP